MFDDFEDDIIDDSTEEFDEEPGTWNFVAYKMDYEGFDYCFRCYAAFEEMKDEEFHKLREAYINAAEELETYVKSKADRKYLVALGIE